MSSTEPELTSTATTAKMDIIITMLRMKLRMYWASMNHQYSLLRARPEKVAYFLVRQVFVASQKAGMGPPMMTNAAVNMLDNLGVQPDNIMYDNFGA